MRALTLLLLAFFATPATAGNSSTYTDFDLKACKQLTPETSGDEGEGSGTFECKGHAGIPVYFAEGDLRSLVSFGKGGEEACAFHQTFSGFNSVGNKIEWRLKNGKPIDRVEVPAGVGEDEAREAALGTAGAKRALDGGQPKRVIFIPARQGQEPKINIVV